MYVLFLETEAAKEIDRWCVENHRQDAEEIKRKAHLNAGKTDNWWVNECLKDDNHKRYDIDGLFIWRDTPEGHAFWSRISNN